MAYTRRQELMCTEAQMTAKPNVVLRDGEAIYIKMKNGTIRHKIGDGVTRIIDLPFSKVFDGSILQSLGDSETAVMSQKAVTEEFDIRTAQIFNPKSYTPQLGTLNYSAEHGDYISTSENFYFIAVPVESGKEYVLYQKIVDSLSFRIAFTIEPKVYGKITPYINFRDGVQNTVNNTINPYKFIVPEGYSYLVINIWYATDPKYTLDDMLNSLYVFKYDFIKAFVTELQTELEEDIAELQEALTLKTAQIYDPKSVTPQLGTLNYSAENGYYISSSSASRFIAVPVESGKEYVLYRKITDNSFFRIAFTNEPKIYGKTTQSITFRDGPNNTTYENPNPYRFTVPEGYSYIVMNIWYATDSVYTLDDMVNSLYIFDAEKIDAEKACAEGGAQEEAEEVEDTTFDGEIAATIREVQEKTVSKAFVFAFMSDSHLRADWAAINRGFDNTVKCLTELNKTLSLDAIVHVGDLVNGYEPFEDIREWNNYGVSKLLSVGAKNVYIAEGNHDGLYRNESDADVRFTDGQIYSHFHRFNDVCVVRDGNPSNYYVDYESHKLRLVVMDNAIAYPTATATWLSAVLEGTPEGYKVIVFSHRPPRPSLSFGGDDMPNYEQFEAILQANAGKIIGHFYGHTHWDNVSYGNGYAEVCISCSMPYRDCGTPVEGATAVPSAGDSEVAGQCFDIVCVLPNENKFELIRFGGGNNRTVPFVQ